jgi:hypothetical protein
MGACRSTCTAVKERQFDHAKSSSAGRIVSSRASTKVGDDRQDIDHEAICVRLLHVASKLAGLIDIDWITRGGAVGSLAARAAFVRSEISRRSFSANAA